VSKTKEPALTEDLSLLSAPVVMNPFYARGVLVAWQQLDVSEIGIESADVTGLRFEPDNAALASAALENSSFSLRYANGALSREWRGAELARGVTLKSPILLGVEEEFHGYWTFTGNAKEFCDLAPFKDGWLVNGAWRLLGKKFNVDVLGEDAKGGLVSTRRNRAGR
jgi:hypothetical protein